LSASFQWRKDLFADLDVDIFFASYALNEIDELPQQALKANTVVLLEPSDRYHSRQLMSWREALIKAGFQILAPCTHQGGCPLLEHSRADFCHDRIPVEKPSWFQKIEDELPINNNSLTFSYLIASKQQPCALKENTARIIGDTLKEKGKTKQMICRSDQREFLSWLKRHGQAPFLPHGSLVELPEGIEVKGSELRVGGQQIKALS
jgi:ribosomal protein RSM22 (predicted rRNA methylase)